MYSKYLTEPIYGTIASGPESDRYVYNKALKIAEIAAKEDTTGKTNSKDLAGAGEGIINDDNI